jgi:hypothetical protein
VQTTSQQVHGDPPRDLCLAAHTRVPEGIVVTSPQQYSWLHTDRSLPGSAQDGIIGIVRFKSGCLVVSWALTLNSQSQAP